MTQKEMYNELLRYVTSGKTQRPTTRTESQAQAQEDLWTLTHNNDNRRYIWENTTRLPPLGLPIGQYDTDNTGNRHTVASPPKGQKPYNLMYSLGDHHRGDPRVPPHHDTKAEVPAFQQGCFAIDRGCCTDFRRMLNN